MKQFVNILTLSEVAELTGGKVITDADYKVFKAAELHEADKNSICFIGDKNYLQKAVASQAGAFICSEEYSELQGREVILSPHPYLAYLQLLTYWLSSEKQQYSAGISPKAEIAASALIAENPLIAANVVILENVRIGKNCRIMPNCVLEKNVQIGDNVILHPNVTVYEDCVLGNNVIVHAGTVIGADGFGYLLYEGVQQKIPQVGNVVIEDDVEIGANTTIDRAALGSTLIKAGTKIDNLVQIGHNCKVGKGSILCSQVGLAGSTVLGNYVYLAGQVGSAGHIEIGDNTMVGAQSGIKDSFPANSKLFGYPAIDALAQKKQYVATKELANEYKTLKKMINEYKNKG